MTDTVTRLMELADVYADRFHEDRKRHTPETVHDRSAARQALQDELTRLLTEAQLREALASHEAIMRRALVALTSDEHCNCIPTPLTDEAIKALEEQLK